MVAVTELQKTPPYRKNTKVRAAVDLPGVPEGTPGKVKLVQGITWLRYWLQFDNGVWLGSVDHSQIVPAAEWDEFLRRREEEAEKAAQAPEQSAEQVEGDEPATGGEAADVNGVAIPPHLLDRAKKARERLGS